MQRLHHRRDALARLLRQTIELFRFQDLAVLSGRETEATASTNEIGILFTRLLLYCGNRLVLAAFEVFFDLLRAAAVLVTLE